MEKLLLKPQADPHGLVDVGEWSFAAARQPRTTMNQAHGIEQNKPKV